MLSPETQKRLRGIISEPELLKALRVIFPNGHEDYLGQCVEEMELHSLKNHDYASGGDSLGNFKRVARILAQYPKLNLGDPRVVAFVYALKQVDAVLWALSQNITAKVEGIVPRLSDIAVYAKIIKCLTLEDVRNKDIDRQFGVDQPFVDELRKSVAAQRAAGEQVAYGKAPIAGYDGAKDSEPIIPADILKSRVTVGPGEIRREEYASPGVGNNRSTCPELNQTQSAPDREAPRNSESPYNAGGQMAGFNSIRGSNGRGRY